MSNRRKTVAARNRQARLNRLRRAAEPVAVSNGQRSSGAQNYPYGPGRRHARVQNETLLAEAGRARREYGAPDPRRGVLEGMSRDQLREVCKAQNVKGYSKMNKAQLIEAALS